MVNQQTCKNVCFSWFDEVNRNTFGDIEEIIENRDALEKRNEEYD